MNFGEHLPLVCIRRAQNRLWTHVSQSQSPKWQQGQVKYPSFSELSDNCWSSISKIRIRPPWEDARSPSEVARLPRLLWHRPQNSRVHKSNCGIVYWQEMARVSSHVHLSCPALEIASFVEWWTPIFSLDNSLLLNRRCKCAHQKQLHRRALSKTTATVWRFVFWITSLPLSRPGENK